MKPTHATFFYNDHGQVDIVSTSFGFTVTPQNPTGYLLFFRGGTGDFGKLTYDYVAHRLGYIAAALGSVVVCPEYGDNDQHGGESDLAFCDKAFESLKPDLPFKGSLGVSRGCMQVWKFLPRHPELPKAPIVLSCPVYDMEKWLEERKDVASMFKEMQISNIESRSAIKNIETIREIASKFLVLGASEDRRVLPHHAQQFAASIEAEYVELDDEHCFSPKKHLREAEDLIIKFFMPK